ncbi:hypothetical protein F5X68DRAFT_29847 [Plectosphaerella plurivora]|uniref:Uncharacterized protein n=1 Tax=Plectosphaerella plurivora TaxID=936078 RepID=A0A9P8VKS2_9PEZI|nr:hypothetical protein F5X68DRAFT_29847 [Plectosphaerella plurivora]
MWHHPHVAQHPSPRDIQAVVSILTFLIRVLLHLQATRTCTRQPRELAAGKSGGEPVQDGGNREECMCRRPYSISILVRLPPQSRQRNAILLDSVEMRRVDSLFSLSLCQKQRTSLRSGKLTQPEQVQLAPQLQVLPPAPEHPQSPILLIWV